MPCLNRHAAHSNCPVNCSIVCPLDLHSIVPSFTCSQSFCTCPKAQIRETGTFQPWPPHHLRLPARKGKEKRAGRNEEKKKGKRYVPKYHSPTLRRAATRPKPDEPSQTHQNGQEKRCTFKRRKQHWERGTRLVHRPPPSVHLTRGSKSWLSSWTWTWTRTSKHLVVVVSSSSMGNTILIHSRLFRVLTFSSYLGESN